jgi:hypothetical protein
MLGLASVALAVSIHGASPGGSPGDAPIQWGERALKIGELPAELPDSARAALEAWHGWSGTHECRLDLDQGSRILLVSRRSNGRAPELLALAVRAVALFDQELPAPPVRLAAKAPELGDKPPEKPKPAAGDKPLPEDPENPGGASHPWKLPPPKPTEETTAPEAPRPGARRATLTRR